MPLLSEARGWTPRAAWPIHNAPAAYCGSAGGPPASSSDSPASLSAGSPNAAWSVFGLKLGRHAFTIVIARRKTGRWSRSPMPPGGLAGDELQGRLSVRMEAAIARGHERNVTNAPVLQQMGPPGVLLPLALPHGFATIVGSSCCVWRADPDVKGRLAAREGCRTEDVSWAETRKIGNQARHLRHRCRVGKMDEGQDRVAGEVVPARALRARAAQRVGGRPVRERSATPIARDSGVCDERT